MVFRLFECNKGKSKRSKVRAMRGQPPAVKPRAAKPATALLGGRFRGFAVSLVTSDLGFPWFHAGFGIVSVGFSGQFRLGFREPLKPSIRLAMSGPRRRRSEPRPPALADTSKTWPVSYRAFASCRSTRTAHTRVAIHRSRRPRGERTHATETVSDARVQSERRDAADISDFRRSVAAARAKPPLRAKGNRRAD